jgi:predicted nicotinamide N-methyase
MTTTPTLPIATPSSSLPKEDDELEDDGEYEEGEGDDDRYDAFFQSIRSPTGLEIGVQVTWPSVTHKDPAAAPEAPMELSTCLPEDEIAPMFHGTQWAGTRVWRAAIVALQYLEQQNNNASSSATKIVRPESTVLELGCGLGVPGILLHKLFDCHVVLTDMDVLVEQLRQNLVTNGLTNTTSDNTPPKIQAQPLDWSVKGLEELFRATDMQTFDVVLNCDCIYEPLYGDSWKMLLKVQEELLKANPATYMLTSVERRKFDNIELYLQGLEDSSVVSRVEKIVVDFDAPPEVELYRLYGPVI